MKLYITGGGTGGHVTPGIAIAKYFQRKMPDTEVRFVGTSVGIESKLVPREGYELDTVDIIGIKRSFKPKDIMHNINAAQKSVTAVHKAKKLLKQYEPDVVIGCGGYASYPVVKAAQQLGIPTVLLEVNALAGKVTKMLSPKASSVLICFEETREQLGNKDNIHLTGAPVRGEIAFANKEQARHNLGLKDQKVVVSFWGSMGALYMNRHMAGVMALECKNNSDYIHIHASGSSAHHWMPELIEQNGGNFEGHENIQLVDYIYNMADWMAAADLVICRAGAATIGELCALGRASIMVPSPYVADNHQEKNARALEKQGACVVLTESESNAQVLFELTNVLLHDDEKLKSMEKSAVAMAKLNATEQIYRNIMQVAKK